MRIGQNCNFHLRNINLKRGDTITWSKASTNTCISQKAVKAKLDSTKQRCPRWTSCCHQASWRGKGAPPAETQGTRQGTSSTLYPAIKVQHSVWLACLSMRQIQTMSRFATITVIEASMLYSKAFLASVTYQCFLTFFLVTHLKKKTFATQFTIVQYCQKHAACWKFFLNADAEQVGLCLRAAIVISQSINLKDQR